MRACDAGERACSVRMLCTRSATLRINTRTSVAAAIIILRTVSASAASPQDAFSSLVTPSTTCATAGPNWSRICSRVSEVSSTVSCSSAATRVVVSIPSSARIRVTATGWVMYSSPLLRICPL
jgi:hypothetical protein